MMIRNCLALGLVLGVAVSGCKDKSKAGSAPATATGTTTAAGGTETAKPVAAAAAPAADMKGLKATAAGWEGEYNAALTSWTFEKYTPGPDDINVPNRIYIDVADADAPADMDAFATKMGEKDFMDMGSKYSAIAEKSAVPGGFLVTGTVQDTMDATAKPEPGFAMVRDAGGTKIRCHSGTMTSEALRAEAIELCKTAKF